MNLNLLLLCWLMLGAAAPRLPQPSTMPDPNDPDKVRAVASREEMEKTGLKARTWTGVVDPDVYTRLDRLNERVASLKDRLNKGRDIAAFDALERIRFKGMVYVQVQLKPDPRISDVQRRVLASLKASEFYAHYLFGEAPGFIGFATKEALDKLAKNPDVVGVCLEDKPWPEGPTKTVFRHELPPPKPGDASSERPGVKEQKVQPEVYRAFDLTDRVNVWISLRPDSLPKPEELPSDLRAQNAMIEQANKQLQDRVLTALSADDFCVMSRYTSGMSGFITQEGLQKLWRHPEVVRVRIQQLMQPK